MLVFRIKFFSVYTVYQMIVLHNRSLLLPMTCIKDILRSFGLGINQVN